MLDSSAPLSPGDLVLDRYRAVEHIANGGHSVVYLGRDERLARPVCIKAYTRYPGDPGISQTSYEHFVQEAFALSRLTHPNTLRIYDFGHLAGDPAHDDDRIPFHVCEYMNGGTLAQLVRERGALPVPARYRPGSTALERAMGHGQGYKYPHEFEGHYVPEDYLPEAIASERIYEPSDSGFERELKDRLEAIQRRKADAKKK